MKGLIIRAVLFGTVAVGCVGCYGYRDCVDPCYPQRYQYASRTEEQAAFAPQVLNGHILDQTVWNYHFEPGTATLNGGGIDTLARLARRRPAPDTVIFLQTAQDVVYDNMAPDKLVEARNDLDAKRTEAVQKFLQAQTANRPVAFHVQIHDPAEVGFPATPVNAIVQQMYGSYRGALQRGGASPTGGAGATGGR
jgi:hypothetical protein